MNKKQRLQIAIDALILLAENDEFIADIVRELQAHHETLTDEGEEDGDPGSNNPPKKPIIP